MPEQPPSFVVVDKRKFTLDGNVREGFQSPAAIAEAKPESAPEPAPVAKVVTMPQRSESPTPPADDLAEESMGGSLHPLPPEAPAYNVDGGDGPETEAELSEAELDEAALLDPPSREETAAQETAYRKSSQELDALLQQAQPGMKAPGAVSFAHLVQSFYLSAVMAMGGGAEPGQKPRIDILGARQAIDLLSVLEEKTRGNLSSEETQLLQSVTFELRMAFLELTNAISRQAHQGAPVPPTGVR